MKSALPLCHIACLDAVDFCVLSNLIVFFQSLGFQVKWSKHIGPCDLLILKRGKITEHESHLIQRIPTIVFSYVGTPTDEKEEQFMKKGCPLLLVAASEALRGKFCESIVSPLPVAVDLWSRAPLEGRYKESYIGNRKNLPDDEPSRNLNAHISEGSVDVWGRWWANHCPKRRRHPPVTVFTVPEIFRRSSKTLGLMYPFQREIGTYSSRYWLAPLSGCSVFTESNTPPPFPGLESKNSQTPTPDLQARRTLANSSAKYWQAQTDTLRTKVGYWLQTALPPKCAIRLKACPATSPFSSGILRIMQASSFVETYGIKYNLNISPFHTLRIWR